MSRRCPPCFTRRMEGDKKVRYLKETGEVLAN